MDRACAAYRRLDGETNPVKRSLFLITLLVAGVFWGCDDDPSLNANDREAVFRILQTGVDHPSDPYVRAETLRIIELLDDPVLDRFAKTKTGDPSPMVRIAALRALLATGKEDARGAVLEKFSDASPLERQAIMDAVIEHGPEPLARELMARALRNKDPLVRKYAFEQGLIARVDAALAQKNTKYLERTLYPELAQYVGNADPVLGAAALRKFVEVGQLERSEPILRTFNRQDLSEEERVNAARVLVGAKVEAAVPDFLALVQKFDAANQDDSLGIPEKLVPPPMLRQALLGLVAAGNSDYLKRVQAYLNNASAEETIEVLEALSSNPSPEASVSLKIAMQDVRDSVRNKAIELYQKRADADPDALSSAIMGTPYSTQRRVTQVLVAKYEKEWTKRLEIGIQRLGEREVTLRVLRDVILTRDEANRVVKPLQPVLQKVVAEGGDNAALAAYLIAISSDATDEKSLNELDSKFDDETRYAFLEFMVRENPKPYARLFRTYFEADLFSVRLMSAAGLWRLSTPTTPAEPPPVKEATEK